ncbi:eukaryotic rRNA processing [Basidiobolus meristosporus CBS 931.73]|uniref:Eukaryotic rRNA processing n=1 Tax=Basidiobolus meristosporus CBS 931.73 TaxID=1314790 RepID=A0A1Y1XZ00_9FUNG|nr:eukaryotic rRNA processing [Basidiobolus meristosporus CBS 931.73]|eukprot:ORX90970.1 eukaryotic rRNA processing [Basidiobolus meristosporus CBS 931.73]
MSDISDSEIPEAIPMEELSDADLSVDEDTIPEQKLTVNNKQGLNDALEEIKLDLPWIETQAITSSEPLVVEDVYNDLKRELAFYNQALEAAKEAHAKITAAGIPFVRPDDYFAEMVKSDEHMQKVRQRLLDESQSIKASEEARKQRELKKFGKKVQVEKLKERQMQKSQELEKIKMAKRKLKDGDMNDDDFDIAISDDDEASITKRKSKLPGKNAKRVKKDAKFGFGGRKRGSKSNTADSTNDISGFSAKGMKQGFKGGKPKRLGKSRRQAGRGKN